MNSSRQQSSRRSYTSSLVKTERSKDRNTEFQSILNISKNKAAPQKYLNEWRLKPGNGDQDLETLSCNSGEGQKDLENALMMYGEDASGIKFIK